MDLNFLPFLNLSTVPLEVFLAFLDARRSQGHLQKPVLVFFSEASQKFRVPYGSLGFLRFPQGSLGFLRVPQGVLKVPYGSLGFFRAPQGSLGFLTAPQVSFGFHRVHSSLLTGHHWTEGSSVLLKSGFSQNTSIQ